MGLTVPGQVVLRSELLEILTDYDFTVDYTADAGGAEETFGIEGGFGIISASKALSWVEQNCALACPGEPTVKVDPIGKQCV